MDNPLDELSRLDIRLFRHIPSQTTDNDKRSLLALHLACRTLFPSFTYLEIGSHLGGSLQSFAIDSACAKIISIDPRPKIMPDARGCVVNYPENSTRRMLELLAGIPGADTAKIQTFEAGTETLQPAAIGARPEFCFIDGEHTDEATLRDARFCLALVRDDGFLAFHDANVVYNALDAITGELAQSGRHFHAYNLPDRMFVVDLGRKLDEKPQIMDLLRHGYQGYLSSLKGNDRYRRVILNNPLFKLIRYFKLTRKLAGLDK